MAQMASCECVISKHDVALENMQADIGYMREGLQGTQQDVDALNQKVENLQSKVDSAVIGDLRSLHLEVRHIQETMACGGDMPKRHTQTTMSQTENAVADSPALNPRVSELQFSTPLPPSHERSSLSPSWCASPAPWLRPPSAMQPPEYGSKGGPKPREFVALLERYFQAQCIPENQWLLQIDFHFKGSAQQWWRYKRQQVRSWEQFKKAFLTYHEGLLSREQTQRDLEVRQHADEPLEAFVWRKYELHSQIYPQCSEEQVTQYIIGLLHPHLKVLIRSMELNTLEQLVQRGKTLQQDLKEEREYKRQQNSLSKPLAFKTTNTSDRQESPEGKDQQKKYYSEKSQSSMDVQCRSCNKFGHYQRNCPRKPQRTPPDKVTAAVTGISTDTDNHLDQGNVRGEAVKQELGPSY
ncbi:UNVERIFIED_CONTAM: hypothetical protein FKN15_066247 [Acipenser sinensis]